MAEDDFAAASDAKTRSHGTLDSELWARIDATYNPALAQSVLQWILEVTKLDLSKVKGLAGDEADNFHHALQNGWLIAEFIQKIKPGIYADIKKSKFKPKNLDPKSKIKAIKCREHIQIFGLAIRHLGIKESDCFTSQALFNGENLNAVVNTFFGLNALLSSSKWYKGPLLKGGFKKSTANPRTFTEEQIRAGKNAIPMTSRGANYIDTNSGVDGAGIVKVPKSQEGNYKASGDVPKWNQGSIAQKSGKKLDKIIMNPNEDYRASGDVPVWNQGSKQLGSGKKLDKIIRDVNEDYTASGDVPAMNQGSLKLDSDKPQHGIIRSTGST